MVVDDVSPIALTRPRILITTSSELGAARVGFFRITMVRYRAGK